MGQHKNLWIVVAIATTMGSATTPSLAASPDSATGQQTTEYEYVKSHTTLIQQIRRSGINVTLPNLEYNPNVIFDPNGARGVKVMGVLQTPDKLQVMLKPRQSSVLEVVNVGSSFNDGQTLVKKVEGANTTEPIITFEEDGIEIQRRVGEN